MTFDRDNFHIGDLVDCFGLLDDVQGIIVSGIDLESGRIVSLSDVGGIGRAIDTGDLFKVKCVDTGLTFRVTAWNVTTCHVEA